MTRLFTQSTPLLSASVLVLTACTAAAPPPVLAYDAAVFVPAKAEAEPARPVTIVETPVPLPLPGQLVPDPGARPYVPKKPYVLKKVGTTPKVRVDAANRAATREPVTTAWLNAVQVYPWADGALYRLYTAPERVSDIALQAGEKLVAVSAGDTVRWVIGDTTSGAGDEASVHILVKPFAPGLATNMVITTDRRTYHLALESTAHTAMAAISWTYPQDSLIALQHQNSQAEAAQPVADAISVEDLRFRYAITGDSPPWRPLRVWDDGRKVYITFPATLDQGEAPPLFVLGASGDAQLVNYRVSGHYYIVDRLFTAAELRLGDKPQAVVRITRTDAAIQQTAQTLTRNRRARP